jgi:N6-adenosine-specific RNA methylase IME4
MLHIPSQHVALREAWNKALGNKPEELYSIIERFCAGRCVFYIYCYNISF